MNRPVVFIGPFEHHSNLIPWRESGCEIVMIPECRTTGDVDIAYLDRLLQKSEYTGRMKMGTFTAVSNVTGMVCDVDRIASTLHKHGALVFLDYATSCSYMKIDMNPVPTSNEYASPSLIAKDAVFISPHKMLGGVGTPGILIIKKHLVSQVNAPSRSGGGTVFYVTNTHHRFLSNRIERYEGGTLNVVGIIRVGLSFLLKRHTEIQYRLLWDQLEAERKTSIPISILESDFLTHARVSNYLKLHAPNVILLKSDNQNQYLPIFSFLIQMGNRFLHYNYVCAILNDVFGIQSRGGCQCAGPYSQRLLGLTTITSDGEEIPNLQNEQLEDALYRFKERAELLRPGYTRISLPFKGMREEEIDYVLNALVWVSRNGWMLMCQYRVNHRTGEWRHTSRQGNPLGRSERRWLSNIDFFAEKDQRLTTNHALETSASSHIILDEAFINADQILSAAKRDTRSISEAAKMVNVDSIQDIDGQIEGLRWFVYPKECAELLMQALPISTNLSPPLFGALNPPSCNSIYSSHHQNKSTNKSRKRKPAVELTARTVCANDVNNFLHASFDKIPEGVDNECEGIADIVETSEQEVIARPRTSNKTTSVHVEEKKSSRTKATWGSVVPIHASGCASKTTCAATLAKDKEISQNSKTKLPGKQSKKFSHKKPPPKLMRLVIQAVIQWDMIKEGDRLLLGLSGGKDSLSLLHCLLELKRKLPTRFEIEVCTSEFRLRSFYVVARSFTNCYVNLYLIIASTIEVDPMTPSFDPSPLIPYVESLGLKYHYVRDDIVSRANKAGKDGKVVSSLCAFCARMKRGNLYTCARTHNCNKLVLAQHLDDCAESLMMSLMHNGFLRTMKANYHIDAGDISVIRPLVYCRESLMTEFSKAENLPVINENCPACFEEPKERARVKKMLSREESLYPNFYDNIRRSLIPLMHDDMSAILRSYTEEVVSRSRKVSYREKKAAEVFDDSTSNAGRTNLSTEPLVFANISDLSEETLLRELARRKAERYKNTISESCPKADGLSDPTGQMCTLNGGNGTIPCKELME